MAEFTCPKCINPIVVSGKVDFQIKEQVALIVRNSGSRLSAVESLSKLGIGLSEVEAIILHETLKRGECHSCKTRLKETKENCSKCGRLNFDW